MAKYTFRFHANSWTDVSVDAENYDSAFELASSKYNDGDYDIENTGFENTESELLSCEDNMEREIIIGNSIMHIIIGKTLEEWESMYKGIDELWNIPLEDFISGAVEVNEDIYYWLIDGRAYETYNLVVND